MNHMSWQEKGSEGATEQSNYVTLLNGCFDIHTHTHTHTSSPVQEASKSNCLHSDTTRAKPSPSKRVKPWWGSSSPYAIEEASHHGTSVILAHRELISRGRHTRRG